MAHKNKKIQAQQEEFFDYDDIMNDELDPESMLDLMDSMMDVHRTQMSMALELTKLMVSNNAEKNKEEQVISAFKKSIQLVKETSDLQSIMNQLIK